MKQRAMQKALANKRAQINEAEREAERRLSRALSVPQIAEAHDKYVNMRFNAVTDGRIAQEQIAQVYGEYLRLLNENGYSENDFERSPVCPICGDSGNDNGKVCRCVRQHFIAALKAECKLDKKAKFTFDDCDFDVVQDENHRKSLKKLYDFMQKYASKLPDVKAKIITLSGKVGTGKSCVASAVARAAVERGKSCKFMSAYEFNSAMLACHTSPIAERNGRLHDVLTADLLVIDDLGTEPIIKKVTLEYLLLVIEERLNAGLCTFITTNLDEKNLIDRYYERIYSRLNDKVNAKFIYLDGFDLRLK